MPYKETIRKLYETLKDLDRQISVSQQSLSTEYQVPELRKRKVECQMEIRRLEKLQWEEDHERTGYGE